MTPETAKLLEQGKLSQRCPTCGTVEAAGWYPTCHPDIETGPDDWYRGEASEAAKAARQSRRIAGFADAGATEGPAGDAQAGFGL